jgi:acyl-CoA thioester hydrolase
MQGIVFYGNYTIYLDETVSTFFRDIGFGHDERSGWDLHVVNVELDYYAQATFQDQLENSLRIDRIGDSSIESAYACRERDTGDLLVEGSITHVAVDEEGEPVRVPDDFRTAVSEYQHLSPE